MMILRWIWFLSGFLGWVVIVANVWREMGWMYGVLLAVVSLVSIVDWLERTMLKQWNMRKITIYEEE